MRLFIGGMRGSQPALGSGFDEFGGDTTSLLLVGSHGERLVLDAGTGMRAVAGQLGRTEPGRITVLFSHYHLDHLIGLTMNPLLYRSEWSFRFVGPTFVDGGVRSAVTGLLAQPYWPISWKQMRAQVEFAEFPAEGVQVGGLRVQGCPVPHPGGSLAYRVDDAGGASLVFATDIEWQDRTDAFETAFKTLCREPRSAEMLVIDAHFGRVQQEAFAGWGHTSWEDGVEIAASTGIPRVLLGHHAPGADDATLRALEQQVKDVSPGAALARAGQWIVI
ncbi:MBL fold metallo-hydrolase [Anaerobaca lacustris]|uniref:MBL fold metallo-hydrolase n=1 Tax=Anaerobaca lacustris TaxID=3044600 RepID=A0AAW6U1B7_9BACT|nr:MBL fold metallo-hydrolase [Sedimentisphaerales bacterium M17dextr]